MNYFGVTLSFSFVTLIVICIVLFFAVYTLINIGACIRKFKLILRRWRRQDKLVHFGVYATFVFTAFVVVFSGFPSCDAEEIGENCSSKFYDFIFSTPNEVGDALAGFASVLAFFWLILTVFLQGKELAEQRKELREQRKEFKKMNTIMDSEKFEAMVFEFIKTHNDIVSTIEIETTKDEPIPHKVTYRGRGCFPFLYGELSREYRERKKKHNDRVALYYAYKHLWNDYGHLLGHYYRFLYNSFKTISESSLTEPHHSRLMRSQMSDYELLLLFYNCISPQGEKFTKYAKKFSLFDNLPSIKVLDHIHWNLLPGTFGGNPLLKPEEFRDWEMKYVAGLESEI